MVVMGSFLIQVLRKVVVSMKPRLLYRWFMFSSLVVSASVQVNISSS